MNDIELFKLLDELPGYAVPYRIEMDSTGRLRFSSMGDGARVVLGVDAAAIVADPAAAYGRLAPEDLLEFARKADTASCTGALFDHVCRCRGPEGERKRIRLVARPERLEDGRLVFDGLMFDLTRLAGDATAPPPSPPDAARAVPPPTPEGTNMEAQQRLLLLGSLSAGLAHDFNNLLMGMLSYVGLAEAATRDVPAAHKALDRIRLGIERGRKLVQEIQLFSTQDETAPRPIDVKRLTEDVFELVKASQPPTVRLELSCPTGLRILADPDHLRRILVNLLSNGARAMSDGGGRLSVTWACDPASPPGEGGRARLTVEDEGVGIPEALLSRVFEPYVSGAKDGRCTGLGLTIVRGLARVYGSEVDVDSAPGRGTRVSLELPCACPPGMRITNGSSSRRKALDEIRGSERILLVDDEELILDGLCKGLKRLGYRVDTCPDAEEASRRLEANPTGWELVVTDMALPGASGADLLARSRHMGAELPFIAITGYHEKVHGGDPVKEGFAAFLQKPFDYRRLGRSIREVLDASGHGDEAKASST